MKEVPLTQGKTALVDDEDYERISKINWIAQKDKETYYAVYNRPKDGKICRLWMHREVLEISDGKIYTDHINGNGLDNQKHNLRPCNKSQNAMNRKPMRKRNKSSKYKGVSWHKNYSKWQAQIKINDKPIFLGRFIDEANAARAYNRAAKEIFGEFAKLNEV